MDTGVVEGTTALGGTGSLIACDLVIGDIYTQ